MSQPDRGPYSTRAFIKNLIHIAIMAGIVLAALSVLGTCSYTGVTYV